MWARRPLTLEPLETRLMLSTVSAVTVQVVGGNLVIKGDELANAITIDQSGLAPNQFRVTPDCGTYVNGSGSPQVFSGVTKDIKIKMGGGDDRVVMNDCSAPRNVSFDGGAGNNSFETDPTQIAGNLTIKNQNGDDAVELDALTVGGYVKIDNGSGNNAVVIDGSSFQRGLTVTGKDGGDSLDIDGTLVYGGIKVNSGNGTAQFLMSCVGVTGDVVLRGGQGVLMANVSTAVTIYGDLLIAAGGSAFVGFQYATVYGTLGIKASGFTAVQIGPAAVDGDLVFSSSGSHMDLLNLCDLSVAGRTTIDTGSGRDGVGIYSCGFAGPASIRLGSDSDELYAAGAAFYTSLIMDGGAGYDRFLDGGGNSYPAGTVFVNFEESVI